MSDKPDIFTEHYSLLRRNAEARQHLIDDPIAALKEYFGSMPEGNYRVEVIPEQQNTITIVLPARPVGGDPTHLTSTQPVGGFTTCYLRMASGAT